MNTLNPMEHRKPGLEHSGYQWPFALISYALFIDVMYRSLIRHEAAWDLLAMVVGGGAIWVVYQARHSQGSHWWIVIAVLALGVAGAVAGVAAMAHSF